MNVPHRSVEQRISLIAFHYVSRQRLPTPIERKAILCWLVDHYTMKMQDHKLADVAAFTLTASGEVSHVPTGSISPSTIHQLLSFGLGVMVQWCPLDMSCSPKELQMWASGNVWLRFIQRHLVVPNRIKAYDTPLGEEACVTFCNRNDVPGELVKRVRHLVAMLAAPLGSYTRYMRANPSMGHQSVSAGDVVASLGCNLDQVGLGPVRGWEQMQRATREIWVMEALGYMYAAHVGKPYLSKDILVYASELEIPGVAAKFLTRRCPRTSKPKLPLIVHLGEGWWQVNSPAMKASVQVQGALNAYATWYECVSKRFGGMDEDMVQCPSLGDLLVRSPGV